MQNCYFSVDLCEHHDITLSKKTEEGNIKKQSRIMFDLIACTNTSCKIRIGKHKIVGLPCFTISLTGGIFSCRISRADLVVNITILVLLLLEPILVRIECLLAP